jgi:hypothetical protein
VDDLSESPEDPEEAADICTLKEWGFESPTHRHGYGITWFNFLA